MDEAGGGGLVRLWSEWGIQIMVLASFSLQLFLLVFGGIRRHSSSAVLRIALWLAYLLADSTAIYALGHLSVATGGSRQQQQHQLMAFWAPFLLLHLGGPDNITAYALEDNSLWLRHLQTLVVQVLGAAYVMYKYMYMGSSSTGTLLLLASISMFVAGLVKYGERIWALKRGNISSIRSSFAYVHYVRNPCDLLKQDSSDEEILRLAHPYLSICKGVLTNRWIGHPKIEQPPTEFGMSRYKLVEMELSLMYDLLYTKASVIHTWYGICLRSISLLATASAFILFQLSITVRGRRMNSDGQHSMVDVVISFVLLVGALVLEAISLCRSLVSSWTCQFLARGWAWDWLLFTSFGRLVRPASKRLWKGSIGQYNFFDLCIHKRDNSELLGSRLARAVKLLNRWNDMQCSHTFSGTESLSMQHLKESVLQALPAQVQEITLGFRSRGRSVLRKMGAYKDLARWSVNIDFDESILVWHIATDVYIIMSQQSSDDDDDDEHSQQHDDPRLVEVAKVLSNYMMFLMVRKSDMLPVNANKDLHNTECNTILRARQVNPEMASLQGLSNGSTEIFAQELFRKYHECPKGDDQSYRAPDIKHAVLLAKELLDLGRPDTLELIIGVWVEMMLYTAEACRRESHARQLSNGGEFVTILWLLVNHFMDYESLSIAVPKIED